MNPESGDCMNRQIFADKLKAARSAAGLTQQDVAKRIKKAPTDDRRMGGRAFSAGYQYIGRTIETI